MKKSIRSITVLLLLNCMMAFSANAQAPGKNTSVKGEEVTYTSGDITFKGYVAYDPSVNGKRPGVLVVPEWWGNNEYAHMRARMLAELGYIAMAVDMYGDGKIAPDPKTAGAYAMPFYKDPVMGKARIEAALNKLKEFPQTNPGKIAAIGYCFGGAMVLNAAKMGMDFKGVVSFHGGLNGVPATQGTTRAQILICHGSADKFVSTDDVNNFKHNLDSVKVPYRFIVYPGATHAFTNPEATAIGKKFNMPIEYNAEGDKRSWEDMRSFFRKIFR